MADTKKYISKINMPVSGTPTDLHIDDADAVHTVFTYNGGKPLGSNTRSATPSTPICLADTPITNTEIDNLFSGS